MRFEYGRGGNGYYVFALCIWIAHVHMQALFSLRKFLILDIIYSTFVLFDNYFSIIY
jgi:hypothetical protein